MKKHSGVMLTWTAVLHTVVGIIVYWQQITNIANDGFINAIDPQLHAGRAAAFWFLMFGILLFMLASLMNWFIQIKGTEVPQFVGVHLLALSLIGVLFLPVSGFWLVIPQAIIIMRK
ncbi:hypothetical protein GK047_11700 [Paenibacillus sp. SYP-B3998]|uniref:DUF4064 domain-containing protein n=1 Tax=Paenibacillus sp. SYP-B3998 TaxID=2678564 RepID=A0A6G3ZXA5_9BACL|nr:DUF6463 family protein [Paenibacillus sp. SYP-B3998]NEW06678.1 hypothetical protein [Paenibacillus sp. SYP-B3998]